MNESDLIDRVATEAGLTVDVARQALDSAFGAIRASCRRGEFVAIAGFGRFSSPDIGPAFVWYGDAGILPRDPDPDERFGWGPEVDRIALYLRENYDPEGFFGIGYDELPTVPESLHPGVTTREDIERAEARLSRFPPLSKIVAHILN